MKLYKNKFIIILRHGERADMIDNVNLDKLRCGKYDTELTFRGKIQAYEAGVKIKEFFNSREIDLIKLEKENKLKLLCSPFARTIMTSFHMLKGLNMSTPICIEKGLCEHLSEKWYPCSPEKFLVCTHTEETPQKVYLDSEMVDHSILHDSKNPLPKYPETHEECTNRLNLVYENITKYYFEECDYNILFFVTHYFPIEVFAKLYAINEKVYDLKCEYCLTLAYNYNKNCPFKNKINFIEKIYPEL